MFQAEGVYAVLPTPFMPDGAVDEESLKRVVDLFIGEGVSGLTALGVTSEVARLNDVERASVLEIVLQHVSGRVPVVAGASADGLQTSIGYSRRARSMGAAAVMVSPPRLPKYNSDAVRRHFSALAEAVDIPIVVQDYPPVSGYAMEASLLASLAREISAARTIKLEDAPTPFKVARIREKTEGVPIAIFGGLGGVYLLEELMAGATGAMTGFAYPRILVDVVRRYHAGEIDRAAEVFYRYVPLMRFEFQEGIGMAIRKEVLKRRGALAHATVRAPGTTLDATTLAALDRVLQWVGLSE